jgi:hypothetical protein
VLARRRAAGGAILALHQGDEQLAGIHDGGPAGGASRAVAACQAMARSWMMSRSSSANAAIMVKKNLPSPAADRLQLRRPG